MFAWIGKLGLNETELKKFLMKKKEAADIADTIAANTACIAELYVQIRNLESQNEILARNKTAVDELAESLSGNLFATAPAKPVLKAQELQSEEVSAVSVIAEMADEIVMTPVSVEIAKTEQIPEITMSLPAVLTLSEPVQDVQEEVTESKFILREMFPEGRAYNGLKGDPEYASRLGNVSKVELLSKSLGIIE